MIFLFNIFIIVFIIFLLIISIRIQIKVQRVEYYSHKIYKNVLGEIRTGHLNPNYQIIFQIYVIKYIPILKIRVNKATIEKINRKTHIKQKIQKQITEENFIKLKEKYNITQDIKEIFQNIKLNIEKLDIKIEIGTENAALTALLIPMISTILFMIIARNRKQKDTKEIQVIPIYKNKNMINLKLEGIFELNMIHIINTICILKKKRRVDEHERTSNRGSYDYSYE